MKIIRCFNNHMHYFLTLIFLALIFNKSIFTNSQIEPLQISVLTEQNITTFTKNIPYVLINFYVPWSELSTKFDLVFIKVANLIKYSKLEIKCAKVDLSTNSNLTIIYELQSYPSLVLFRFGEPIYSQLIFNPKQILKWLNIKTSMLPKELTTQEEIKEIQEKDFAVLLSFPSYDLKLLNRFIALAANYPKLSFYFTNLEISESFLRDHSLRTMVVFRSFDDGRKILEIPADSTFFGLRAFLERVRWPLVLELNKITIRNIVRNRKECVILLTEQEKEKVDQFFNELAVVKKGELLFLKGQISKGLGAEFAARFGLGKNETDAIFIVDFSDPEFRKYKLTDLTKKGFENFLENHKTGNLRQFVRSESLFEDNLENGLTKIVGDNFDQKVMATNKSVVLAVYGPAFKCNNCQEFLQTFEKLAKVLAKNEELTFAKIDAFKNENINLRIRGLPILRLYKQGIKGYPIDYEGDGRIANIIEFLETKLGIDLVFEYKEVDFENDL